MKNQLRTQNYLFIILLIAVALLLAACGTTADTASAAESDLVNIEETIAEAAVMAEAVDSDEFQEAPVDDNIQNSEAVAADQAAPGNGYGANGNGQNGPGQGEHITPDGELTQDEI